MSRERIMLTQAIPAVQQLRRVQGFDPLRFLKRNVNGGIELGSRYQRLWFRLACPDGKMLLNRLRITDQIAVYEAQVFLSREDNQPIANFTAAVEKAQAPAGRYVQAAQDAARQTRERALAWAVAEASVEEIDRLNILHATMLAMQRAVLALGLAPGEVLIDGNRCPQLPYPARAIVKGDASEPAISAASILAKTARDEAMRVLDAEWPQYGLAAHKGYPTAAHLAALEAHGVRDFYRRSFGPVKRLLPRGAGR